jgi:hypothetical protein
MGEAAGTGLPDGVRAPPGVDDEEVLVVVAMEARAAAGGRLAQDQRELVQAEAGAFEQVPMLLALSRRRGCVRSSYSEGG